MAEHKYCPNFNQIAWRRAERVALAKRRAGGPEALPRAEDRGDFDGFVVRLRCKEWSCEYCAQKNQAQWRAHLHSSLEGDCRQWQLITLTPMDASISTFASYKSLQSGWGLLLNRMRRVHGNPSYIRTFEKFPTNNALHIHAILTGLSPYVAFGANKRHKPTELAVLRRNYREGIWSLKTWLKRWSVQYGMGFMADIKPIPTAKALNYVTKYLTKELQGFEIKGLRRIATSRDIPPLPDYGEGIWTRSSYIVARDFKAGAKILDLQTGEVIDNNHWEAHDYYPLYEPKTP